MKLAICYPFYFCYDAERYEITRRMLHHYSNMVDEFGDVVIVGTGSEGDLSRELWNQYLPDDWYFEYDQSGWASQPTAGGCPGLTHKFNETVHHARGFGPDRVQFVGSDDYLDADYLQRVIDSDAGITGPSSTYVVQNGRHIWWDGFWPCWPELEVCGGQFSWHHDALDLAGWEPWKYGPHEGHVELTFTRELGCSLETIAGGLWMVKAGLVLNQLQGMVDAGFNIEPAAPEAIKKFHDVWDAL